LDLPSISIINVACIKALAVRDFDCADGTNIHLWEANGSGAQAFRFDSNGTFASTLCGDSVVDIDGPFYRGADESNFILCPRTVTGISSGRLSTSEDSTLQ
jgi:hypothetical protein